MKSLAIDMYLVGEDCKKFPVPGIFDERCKDELFEAIKHAFELGFNVELVGSNYET